MNIKPVYNERDVRRLRELYHACETNCRGLKTLGVDESSYATIVVPEILDKLPESLRLTITRGACKWIRLSKLDDERYFKGTSR